MDGADLTERAPLPPIKFAALADALLARADTLVPAWMPGGVRRGHEYVCGSLDGGEGDSCAVNLTTGRWCDFGGGPDDRGLDLVSLYAATHGFSKQEMGKAAVQVAREEGLESVAGVTVAPDDETPRVKPERPPAPPKPVRELEKWRTLMPVPPNAPPANFWHYHRNNDTHKDPIDHTATYMVDGQLLGYVVRFIDSSGDKETLPYTWCISEKDGLCKWNWKTWDEPRPLYIPSQAMPKGRTVVLVEGEKKAEKLHAVLEAGAPGVYAVMSWPGGCNGWKKAMWSWLDDCSVLLWPDCDSKHEDLTRGENAQFVESMKQAGADKQAHAAAKLARTVAQQAKPLRKAYKQPGMAAMLGIGALLQADHRCTVQILPIAEPGVLLDGWDCADAIDSDGWDFDRILSFFGGAQPLPEEVVKDAAAAGGGGKGGKPPPRDGPADAVDGDADKGSGGFVLNGKEIPWWLAPYWDSEKGRWLPSRKMVIKALQHDPELQGLLGMNQLSNNIDARVAWPWAHAKAGPITGAIDLMLGDFLSRKYGLPAISRAALMEGIETVAHGTPFHPIREWLGTIKRDDKSRIDKWLIYALGETPETLEKPVFEYLQLVGRYWLLGMVYRVMHPGIKFDYCPVLEGPGGYRKSTLVEALAGSEYFSDTHFDVSRGKEGQEQVQGLWMYEIAELANFGKAEIGLIKAFISGKVDKYRPSYGRVVESFPRQCILVGTTNERTYLRDRTGNRRFWPVPVRNRINIEWVVKHREVLLAEAYELYLAGAQFTPTPDDEKRLFVPMQEMRLVETAVMSEMTNVLTRNAGTSGMSMVVNTLTDFVTIAQLTLALGVDAAKSSPALEGQIRSWLEHEGWERVKKQIQGARAWGYLRPPNWPPADPDLPGTGPAQPTTHPAPVATSAAGAFIEGADDEPF
ncbi:MAG TPA: VapE domain-containing protein [Polaromonas sp.]|uniref:VapE domain-containing protein n=1 Tax=Polaromonas sp. TaxID=1869339 RepID=UPI002D75AF36|nr:VapE domain-containing protein [Polaromonas sp.]HYW57695.1 VapE domain-containing protein [Polaromonas sp.]